MVVMFPRRAWFWAYLAAEFVACVAFIASSGVLAFFGEIFLSAVVGLWLVGGAGVLGSFFARFDGSLGAVFSQMGLAFGGFLLFLPGILGDCVGGAVVVLSLALRLFGRGGGQNSQNSRNSREQTPPREDVIDVEIIDEKETR